jgi:hypothetical protein
MKSHQTTIEKRNKKTKPLITVGTHIVKVNANKPNAFAHRSAIKPTLHNRRMNVHVAVVNIYTQRIERHITSFFFFFFFFFFFNKINRNAQYRSGIELPLKKKKQKFITER